MQRCFDCYAENGFGGTGIQLLAQYCGCAPENLYLYFEDMDDLIIQSAEYCMSKVEEDFMAKAPRNVVELEAFINEVPYWTAQEHGSKYRLMYQIYTHPKYREHGKRFFAGVNKRYVEYAKSLENQLGIPYEKLTSMIFILIRACVHYALFEDYFYLQAQMDLLMESIELSMEKYAFSIDARSVCF